MIGKGGLSNREGPFPSAPLSARIANIPYFLQADFSSHTLIGLITPTRKRWSNFSLARYYLAATIKLKNDKYNYQNDVIS